MASLIGENSKMRIQLQKPPQLKDYLLDDLSSCSSNGFRSYPRKQCCTSVRFLLDIDLINRDSNHHNTKRLLRSKIKSASSSSSSTKKMSAFQRASMAVVNAVKLLPFTSAVKSPPSKQSKNKRTFLPRSLSKKLLKRSFWKKTSNEIERWKSFRYLLEDEQKPSDSDFSPSATTVTAATESNSSTSQSNSNSNSISWSDSDFTAEYLRCSSGDSENSCGNDVVVVSESGSPEKLVISERVGGIVGDDSTEEATTTANNSVQSTKKQWPNKGEKEQFSPVSVLDFQSDEEEEVSSPFQSRLARLQGTKQQLMNKIQRFEKLAQLQPVDLEKQFEQSEHSYEDELVTSPPHSCSESVQDNNTYMLDNEQEEENQKEEKALDLLELMKATISSTGFKYNEEYLLLDFFRERISEDNPVSDTELLNEAKDWIEGQCGNLLLGWEVQKNRQAYLTDMEKRGIWRKLDDEDKQEVAMELEVEVFDSLVDELLLELMSS